MIKCPHCHKLNRSDAKFCKYCGTRLDSSNNNASHTSSNASTSKSQVNVNSSNASSLNSVSNNSESSNVSSGSNRSTSQANNGYTTTQVSRDPNDSNNFANHYFTWVGKSLRYPSSVISSNHYFGLISFAIEAILLIISLLIGTHSSSVSGQLMSYVGELPIDAFYNNSLNDEKPFAVIVLVLLFFIMLVLVGFVGHLLVSKTHQDIMDVTTKLAGYTNINLMCLFLLLVSVLLQSVFLSWIFAVISKCTLLAGLSMLILNASRKKNTIDSIYVFIGSIVAFIILTGLLATIVGILFQ